MKIDLDRLDESIVQGHPDLIGLRDLIRKVKEENQAPKKRGRPRISCARVRLILVLWAISTLDIEAKRDGKRDKLSYNLATFEGIDFEEASSIRKYTRLWNNFVRDFNSGKYPHIHLHLDDSDVVGSRITRIEQIIDKPRTINLTVLLLLVENAMKINNIKCS